MGSTIEATLHEAAKRVVVTMHSATREFESLLPARPEDIRVRASRTGGYWAPIGALRNGGRASLFLDRFAGHSEPYFWFGFDVKSGARQRAIASLAQEAGISRKPLIRTLRDLNRSGAYLRYRDPLQTKEFDRLTLDQTASEFFVGIHYPKSWRMSGSLLRQFSDEVAQFMTRFACAMDGRAKSSSRISWARPDPVVEKRAIQYVVRCLREEGYLVSSRESEICGYDLVAECDKEELHIEVKGSSIGERFFLTRNEWNVGRSDPSWRLFLVTNVIAAPRLQRFTPRELKRSFAFDALSWSVERK